MERLAELWPGLVWEERRSDLYRAEENDGDPATPPWWRYALIKDDKVASMIAQLWLARTDLDEQGIAEQLEQYVAIGRVQ